jgi:hypothetical protein
MTDDGILDPTDPPHIFIEGADVALPPQQARELAAALLSAADAFDALNTGVSW